MKVIGGFSIRQVPAADRALVEAARWLLNHELGEELYKAGGLLAAASGGARSAVFVPESSAPAALVAAAVVRILTRDDLGYYAPFGDQASRFAVAGAASLEALAVAPEARRKGVGTALVRARLRWARGAPAATAVAWLSGSADLSASIFRSLGFEESPRVDEFYLEDSLQYGWRCPTCGGPCRCAAVLFGLPGPI